jgi:intracellular septation protein A
MKAEDAKVKQKKRENPFLSLGFNIILPSIIMAKADEWFGVSPTLALLIALAFPLGYGLVDFIRARKCNVFSVVGFGSVLLTGVIGLLQLPKEYIAIKEALVPALIGLIVFVSAFTRYPLIKALLFNEAIMNIDLIDEHLRLENDRLMFQKILSASTVKFSLSFALSAVLNYVLARYFIHSNTGTAEFNRELARMTFWSYPAIVLPCTVILMLTFMGLIRRLESLTGLTWERMLVGAEVEEEAEKIP